MQRIIGSERLTEIQGGNMIGEAIGQLFSPKKSDIGLLSIGCLGGLATAAILNRHHNLLTVGIGLGVGALGIFAYQTYQSVNETRQEWGWLTSWINPNPS